MKSSGSKEFSEFVYRNQRGYTKAEAADVFVKCWKSLNRDLINKSWNLYTEFSSSSSSDSSSSEDSSNDNQSMIEEELNEEADALL